jgi:hypothetical protein
MTAGGGVVALLAGGATFAAPATPAFASAFEYTFAPGGADANQCLNVWGNATRNLARLVIFRLCYFSPNSLR